MNVELYSQALGFNPTPELIREIESKLLTRNEDGMVPDDVNILLPNFLAIVPPMLADPQVCVRSTRLIFLIRCCR